MTHPGDLEEDRPEDLEEDRPEDLEEDRPEDLEEDRPEDQEEDRPEDQEDPHRGEQERNKDKHRDPPTSSSAGNLKYLRGIVPKLRNSSPNGTYLSELTTQTQPFKTPTKGA